jgi:hypothetical protein
LPIGEASRPVQCGFGREGPGEHKVYSFCSDGLTSSPWSFKSPKISPKSPKSDRCEELFTLRDFRPGNQILVITISTISMCRNCSISCLAAPGGARAFSHIWTPPGIIMTCRVCVPEVLTRGRSMRWEVYPCRYKWAPLMQGISTASKLQLWTNSGLAPLSPWTCSIYRLYISICTYTYTCNYT